VFAVDPCGTRGGPCALFRSASSWRSSRLWPWLPLQQIVFLFTQIAPKPGWHHARTRANSRPGRSFPLPFPAEARPYDYHSSMPEQAAIR
jgi:hypothetical protein